MMGWDRMAGGTDLCRNHPSNETVSCMVLVIVR